MSDVSISTSIVKVYQRKSERAKKGIRTETDDIEAAVAIAASIFDKLDLVQ